MKWNLPSQVHCKMKKLSTLISLQHCLEIDELKKRILWTNKFWNSEQIII